MGTDSNRPRFGSNAGPPARGETTILTLIILTAYCIRAYGLSFGIPHYFHPDERIKVEVILGMVDRGSGNPQYFFHPSLLLYLSWAAAEMLSRIGSLEMQGVTVLLAGRVVSLAAGTISVYLTWALGRRLHGSVSGMLASGCLAVFPLHIACSRYLKEDALLLMFVLCCLVAVVKSVQLGSTLWWMVAGIFAGLAASTKYSGFLLSLPVLLRPYLVRGGSAGTGRQLRMLPLILLCTAAAFVLASPYTVLDSSLFLRGFDFERRHMLEGHLVSIDAWSQLWTYHLRRSLVPGMTFLPMALSIAGCLLFAGRRRPEDLFILGCILLFYLPAEWVRAKVEPQPDRYVLPCLPFLAIAASEIVKALCARRLLPGLTMGALMLVFPIFRSVALALEIPSDTRIRAAEWIEAHLPPGSAICIDAASYGPALTDPRFTVRTMGTTRNAELLRLEFVRGLHCNYLVLSSLLYARYVTPPLNSTPEGRSVQELFDSLEEVGTIIPRQGTYGFHNPTIRIFRVSGDVP